MYGGFPLTTHRITCLYGVCAKKPFRTNWRLRYVLHNMIKHRGDW